MLSLFVSGFQKCHLFCRTTIINTKYLSSLKSDVITFFGHCKAKIKALTWTFAHKVIAICLHLDYIYRFLNTFKIFDFVGIYFLKNQNLDFWGRKPKKEIRDSRVVENAI